MSAEKLVGDVPRLPLRIAAQVAWSSIKVRMSRSLVTVSSVVLAVAFLLVVIGGDIADRSVYKSYSADNRANADVGSIYELLSQPRQPLVLIDLLATDNGIRDWAASYGVTVPPYEAADAERGMVLVRWIEDLKATNRFKALENSELHTWLLNLDQPGAVDRFLGKVETFRGVRLPFEAQTVHDLASRISTLRDAAAALRQAEKARLALVAKTGGTLAVMETIRDGQLSLDAVGTVGLPLEQALGQVDDARYQAIRDQLDIRSLRDRARGVLDSINKVTIVLTPLTLEQLRDGTLAERAGGFAAEVGFMNSGEIAELEQAMLTAGDLSPLEAALLQDPDIAKVTDPEQQAQRISRRMKSDEAKARLTQLALETELSSEEIAALGGELTERSRLDTLAETFKNAGFDPEDAGSRTFWLLVLSLMVCIVGIVNSMMMAVTERFREIATMKCLGAMDNFILKAFLIESGSVGLVGAFLGAILGVLIVLLQSSLRYGSTFWGAFPGNALLVASFAALACGILLTVFGALLPAWKAARMHPIEAMRLET
ncbi:MAG: FtsX-like permease family protein [Planctomycetota bacterium]|jgi:putative ABC transport system permease protein|nr:FtsX-like permease family protein [Planctomycetota bacterium]